MVMTKQKLNEILDSNLSTKKEGAEEKGHGFTRDTSALSDTQLNNNRKIYK